MNFRNSTNLDGDRLHQLFVTHSWPWRHDALSVHVRDSRGADFSGRYFYRHRRIYINLGPRNRYPYHLATHVARSKSNRTHWWREFYMLELADPYQLATFIYLHELFHHLVGAAKRCTRRKEAMCDRFATRAMVDHFRCPLRRRSGESISRSDWDFQDLDRFVAAAPKQTDAKPLRRKRAARIPVRDSVIAALDDVIPPLTEPPPIQLQQPMLNQLLFDFGAT